MKKLSLLILLALIISISGVYATWVYTQTDDIADTTMGKAVSMSGVTFEGSYGTYAVDTSGATILVDPKAGTTHTTALKIEGQVVFTFKSATYAPDTVKKNAVPSTFSVSLSNADWKYEDALIFNVEDYDNTIVWEYDAENDIFTFVLDAEDLASIITIIEFNLDTKAKYDVFDKALEAGTIVFGISDGKHTTPAN